jgi:WD40 repeat protein
VAEHSDVFAVIAKLPVPSVRVFQFNGNLLLTIPVAESFSRHRTGLSFCDDGKYLLFSVGNDVFCCDLKALSVSRIAHAKSAVRKLAGCHKSSRFITAHDNLEINVWDINRPDASETIFNGNAFAIDFSPLESFLLTLTGNDVDDPGKLVAIDINDGRIAAEQFLDVGMSGLSVARRKSRCVITYISGKLDLFDIHEKTVESTR